VTRAEDVKAALAKTVEAFGRLDFGFNNAGIEPRKPAPTAEYEEEEWNRIIDTNLRGVFLCMKHEIPLILKQGGGAIVNTSSGAGIIGIKGSPAYTAAKHGVIGLTRAADRPFSTTRRATQWSYSSLGAEPLHGAGSYNHANGVAFALPPPNCS
jgi:NAD(P)-dependent dehydrogenase (short-subunit alcohol dehydrogenase family)